MDDIQVFPPQKKAEKKQKTPKLYSKTRQALDLVANHGLDAKKALILATNNLNPNKETVRKFKQKVAKYALTSDKVGKLAHNAVLATLKGEALTYDAVKIINNGPDKAPTIVNYQEIIPVRAADRLAAASMYYDRVDPIVRANLNINANVDFLPVDLDDYR